MSIVETAAHYGRKLVRKVYKPEVDPGRAERVYREFDERRGFGRYHALSRERLARSLSAPAAASATELARRGVHYERVMSPEDAAQLLETLTAGQSVSSVKKGNADLEGYRFDQHPARQAVLAALLNPAIDQLILDYFASEYLIHWALLSRTAAAEEQAVVSFKWHCDKGPARHLKLLCYLNGSEEHGGNTEFIELAGSKRVAEKGYLFGRTDKRSSEVSRLSRLAGCELQLLSQPIDAGEAVIFSPATVLHRGVSPTRAARFVLTLCLLPSPVPWQQAYQQGVTCDLAQQAKWPRHADDLLSSLNVSP